MMTTQLDSHVDIFFMRFAILNNALPKILTLFVLLSTSI